MHTTSDFIEKLGIRFPIIQAPMAGVSTPELAAAVSNAGGLGSLGIGASTIDQARNMIEQTRRLTRQPFNVNVFCHAAAKRDSGREKAWLEYLAPLFSEAGLDTPDQLDEIYTSFLVDDEQFEMLLELRPTVISFHFGIPSADCIACLREAGIYTMATATNLYEATLIEQAGIDAIVAQGTEAGGHRGMFNPEITDECLSTMVLVRLLAAKTTRPIIAAGGIMDGYAISSMLSLGAVAAQMGTAFVLCPESAANTAYRENLKGQRATQTRLTDVLSGRPARGMVNRLVTFGEAENSPLPADYPLAYDAVKRLSGAASKLGNNEFAAQWAGQGAPLARELPASTLMRVLMAETRRQE
jgi:nitronate monooxygenase